MLTRFEESQNNGQASRYTREAQPPLSLAPDPVNVVGIQVNKSKLKLKVGQQETLHATILPHNAANQSIEWTSNKPEIAEIIQDGQETIVRGRQPGRAILIVTTDEGKFRDICIVTVQTYLTNPN